MARHVLTCLCPRLAFLRAARSSARSAVPVAERELPCPARRGGAAQAFGAGTVTMTVYRQHGTEDDRTAPEAIWYAQSRPAGP